MKPLFKNIFGKTKPKGSKDPKDFKKCELSGGWKYDDFYCGECLKSVGHNEYMCDVCNGCGYFNSIKKGRSYRKIFIEGKWKYQYKYQSGHYEIVDEKYRKKIS